MNPSPGDRKRVLLTGASGKFGTKFIELFASRFEIIALTHANSIAATTRHGSLFDPVDGVHAKARVKEVKCDLTDMAAVKSTVNLITDLVGPLDYLVNAAADVRFLGSTLDFAEFESDAERQLKLNVCAPALIASLLFHRTWKHVDIEKQDVSILNLSSISGKNVFQGTQQAIYAASKAALNMLTLYMAAEYRACNVRVNGLSPNSFPGVISTDVVVKAAMQILESRDTGKIFDLGVDKRR